MTLESRNRCFFNVFNIVDVPAINLFFFLKRRIFNQLLFFKKICASEVLRDGYGNLIRCEPPGQCYFELILSFNEGKRRLNLNHFGKFLQIIRAVFNSK